MNPPSPDFSMLADRRVMVREGEEGTDLASDGLIAVIADALRASATIIAFLEAGAREIQVFAEEDACREAAVESRDAVTAGERDGVALKGFDYGNSPCEARRAPVKDKIVFMTTTTGALRIVESRGSPSVLIGSPNNLTASAKAAAADAISHKRDIVVVAAGNSHGDADGMTVEDLASASLIASKIEAMGAKLDKSAWVGAPESVLPELFRNCPNGRKLNGLGYAADVKYCAELDRSSIVPQVADWIDLPNGDVAAVIRKRAPERG